jgi:hypothetical protein
MSVIQFKTRAELDAARRDRPIIAVVDRHNAKGVAERLYFVEDESVLSHIVQWEFMRKQYLVVRHMAGTSHVWHCGTFDDLRTIVVYFDGMPELADATWFLALNTESIAHDYIHNGRRRVHARPRIKAKPAARRKPGRPKKVGRK